MRAPAASLRGTTAREFGPAGQPAVNRRTTFCAVHKVMHTDVLDSVFGDLRADRPLAAIGHKWAVLAVAKRKLK